MKPISELAAELVGGAGEVLPVGGGDVAVDLVNFPIHRRLRLVREEAQFTTNDGHNHMLSFGEFVALHLVAWSTRAWKALSTESDVYKELKTSIADKLTDWEGCHKDDLGQPSLAVWTEKETKVQEGQVTTAFERDTGRVLVYQATVARAARLLANCATYMIFDDHEITDDWNQSKQWRNRVVSRPLGRAILRNGMMAYTVCQAWGNDPRAFTRADKSIFDPLAGLPEPAATSPIWALEKAAAGQPEKLTNNGSLLKVHPRRAGRHRCRAGRRPQGPRQAARAHRSGHLRRRRRQGGLPLRA